MNKRNPSPTISKSLKDRCDHALKLIAAGDYRAACDIQTEFELSSEFGAYYAAQIIQFQIFITSRSESASPVKPALSAMPVQGGVQ